MASEVVGSPRGLMQNSPRRPLHVSPPIRRSGSLPGGAFNTGLGTPVRPACSAPVGSVSPTRITVAHSSILPGSPSNGPTPIRGLSFASLFGGSPRDSSNRPSVDVAGLTLPVSAVSTVFNVEASVAGTNWQYVGEGHGGYSKVQKYKYVGVGGDWEKEVTEIPTNWRMKKFGFFILALFIVGPLIYLGSGLVMDDTEEEQNAVTEKVLIGPASNASSEKSANEANQRQGPEPDCTVGMFNWKHWNDDKKQFCCRTRHIGCEKEDPFDCDVGRVNWWQSWDADKQTWCCEEKQVGCPSQAPESEQAPFDCNEDYVSCYHCLLKRWSEAKREWCCHHGGRGCPTPPPPPPQELPRPLRAMTPPGLLWPSGTPPPPQAHHRHAATKAPPKAPTTTASKAAKTTPKAAKTSVTMGGQAPHPLATKPPPKAPVSTTVSANPLATYRHAATKPPPDAPTRASDQRAATKPPPEAPDSSTTVSQAPQSHVATAPLASPVQSMPLPRAAEAAAASSALFRPDLEEAHPAKTTTPAKSAKEAALAATTLPFACKAGLTNWEQGWSLRKKAWCCQHEQRGCPHEDEDLPYNCEDGYRNCHRCIQDRWSAKKKAWCCQHDGTGCASTNTTTRDVFNCKVGATNWKSGWSSKKKDWCCQHSHVGCSESNGVYHPLLLLK